MPYASGDYRANRSPVNCHRRCGWKKLRYVGLLCPFGVATDAPRSTIWLIMNLPLYSPTAPPGLRKPGYGRYADEVHSQREPQARLGLAASHSNSVGRRMPFHSAKADASYHE